MTEPNPVSIDKNLCTGCGRCVNVCPLDCLSIQDGLAVVSGHSMLCGHCAAACPTNAIQIHGLDPESTRYDTFSHNPKWLPPGESDTGELVRLMRSRRSCRNFTPDPVPPEVLTDLVKIGATAPSGTNSQRWTFTIVPDRDKVEALAEAIKDYFTNLNTMAKKPWLRTLLRLLGKPELGEYYREYYDSVSRALTAWERDKRDLLFHSAPALIIVGSREGASCPAEDSLLATQNILLAAHSMGWSTCLIGFAVAAINRHPALKQHLATPPKNPIHTVIAIGRSKERYKHLPGRKPIAITTP